MSSLSDTAYDHIRDKLVQNAWSSGQKVSENRLARELGISRTPIREAIHRLKSDGLLVQVASGGTFVAEPTRLQLVEMYEIRLALESMLIDKAIRLIRPKEVTQLLQFADEMLQMVRAFRDSGAECMPLEVQREFLATDLAFHRLIARVGHNHLAYKMVNDVHLRHRAFGLTSHRRDLHHVAWVWLYHARIAAAIRQRDAKSARRLMQRHIRFSMKEALFVFDSGGTQAVSPARGKPRKA